MTTIDYDNPLWPPALEPDPDILKLQLTALVVFLERPFWLVEQAAFLLAGVCPPERRHDERIFGSYLPGRWEWQIQPKLGRQAIEDRIAEIETLLREAPGRKGSTPLDFLEFATYLGIEPPWIEYAKNDPECAKFLALILQGEPTLQAEQTVPTDHPTIEIKQSAQSIGGTVAAENNPVAQAGFTVKEFLKRALADKWTGYLDHNGKPDRSAVRKAALAQYEKMPGSKEANSEHFGKIFNPAWKLATASER